MPSDILPPTTALSIAPRWRDVLAAAPVGVKLASMASLYSSRTWPIIDAALGSRSTFFLALILASMPDVSQVDITCCS